MCSILCLFLFSCSLFNNDATYPKRRNQSRQQNQSSERSRTSREEEKRTSDRQVEKREPDSQVSAMDFGENVRLEALKTGRKIILMQLKNPSSAEFIKDAVLLSCSDGTFITAHNVEAENSFGGRRTDIFCTVYNIEMRRTTIQPNLCDSVEYTSSRQSKNELCNHWSNIMKNSKFTGVQF